MCVCFPIVLVVIAIDLKGRLCGELVLVKVKSGVRIFLSVQDRVLCSWGLLHFFSAEF